MDASKDVILEKLKGMLNELFEIDPEDIRLESKLFEDLDLDSIDAVDLVAHLQSMTKRKLNIEEFKSVRSVSDLVNVIHQEVT
jgi:acyl carrier protein